MEHQLIYQSSNSKVFVEEHEEYGKVIVKHLNEEFPAPRIIKQFSNEFEILQGLSIEGVRKAFNWTKTQNKYTIYLEYIDGITIRDYSKNSPPIKNLLRVFRSMIQVLAELHAHNIIHKDITPANILVYPDKLKAVLIDFGTSTKLNLKTLHLGNPDKLEGTLAYISPEQTGRLNRVVDYRTDIYSLGAVMYEVFGKKLPFDIEDPLELIHAHIATIPKPLHELDSNIPKPLSRIVSKLMEKNAEDRYQSANGLLKDIDKCLKTIDDNGQIEDFEIAQEDITDRFQLVQRLYGREVETDNLIRAFDSVSKGPSQLMLVSGYSGTGKSALVAEVHKPITKKKGYFIDGKFDQYQRAVPYFAILQAFNSYINLLLTEDEEKLEDFKEEIQAALGEEGQVLTDVLPNLELIIGEQAPVPEVSGADARNRFKYVFQKFLNVICSEEHPIVLFIDDLQWADSSSLDLLSALLKDHENEYFLCICAYRDNEVDAAHPFIIMVDELREQAINISEIHIGNLKLEDAHHLISDSLKLDINETEDLTALVYEKTQGNAFFLTQFLKALYEEQHLKFDTDAGRWNWDLKKIKALNITDNVVDFMAGKIKRLDSDTQDILISAASVGNVFDLKTLSIIHEISEEEIADDLEKPLSEGWILLLEDHYKFSHDRIQQAVYSLIPESRRNILHLEIGRHLLGKFKGEQLDENLFDIVNQMNWGIELIDDASERLNLCELNYLACKKAKTAAAFNEAYKYVQNGLKLLPDDPWTAEYELCQNLYQQASETAFLVADFEPMNRYIDAVIDNSKELLNRVQVNEIRINAYKAQNNLKDALSTGFDILSQLGEKFPKKAGPLTVMPDLIKTALKLRNKEAEDIINLPDMLDEEKKAAMRILANIAPSSYWGDPAVFPHIIFRIVQLSLKHGNTAVSAFGFATYGVIQIGVLGKNDVGYKYGQIGLKILERFDAKEWVAQVYNPIYGLIFIWGDHVRTTLKPLLDSYHIGLETGAIEFACINANLYCINSFLIGRQLGKLEDETAAYSRTFAQYKQEINYIYNEVYRQAMHNFMGRNDNPVKLVGDAFDEFKMLEEGLEEKNRTGTFFIYFLRIILANYFGEIQYAWDNIPNTDRLLDSVLAKLELAHYAFNVGLAASGYYPMADQKEKSKARKLIKKNISKLKAWSKHSPENYLHKLHLLKAEQAKILGKKTDAREYYDLAIAEVTKEPEYLHEEAIIYERAGQFHVEEGNEILAGFYLKNAFQSYRFWGAKAKLSHLVEKYPKYLAGIETGAKQATISTISTTSTTSRAGSSLDLNTILKASTALSGEIVLEKLLKELMRIVSENAGANKAFLLLKSNKNFFIEAGLENHEVNEDLLLKSIPLRSYEELPKTVIKYLQRTKQSVIMSKAIDDPTFSQDPYIQKFKPKSILASPILNQGELTGILYLENNLTEGAFSESTSNMVDMLSGQIAVSIENARLYESLEQKVEERTNELAIEKQKSDDLLLNILPRQTANELKQYGKAKSRRYEMVTVLFTDFKNFTQITETMEPEELVSRLGVYFEAFDKITEKYGIEKIKTIGDAYMCVSGIPTANKNHAINAINAAIEIRDFMLAHSKSNESGFDIRIGLNSGPVIAGVVGLHKFAYDIWGDTVNTASRMESNSEASKINISGSTYELVKDKVTCTHRGKIPAKNKGDIDMYFVEGFK